MVNASLTLLAIGVAVAKVATRPPKAPRPSYELDSSQVRSAADGAE
jgi:hypothetical protein